MLTPDSPENYEAYKGRQRQQDEKRQQFQAVTRLEGDTSSPVSDAQLSDHVAELTGSKPAPEDMVRANRELFREAVDHVWADGFRDRAPITLAMASDPNSKPISKSDADIFAAIEQTANKVGNGPSTMGDRALGRGIQLASGLISVSGPRGSGALPPFPLPKPPSSALPPFPLPKPLPPIPLPKPETSPAVTAPPEGKEDADAPADSVPTAAPAEGMSPGAPSVEGVGQPSVVAGPGAQTDVSSNAAGASGGASAQPMPTTPPLPEAARQGAAATAPAEEVNPNANTTGAAGTPPAQAAPAAGGVAGQAVASETPTGQDSGTGTAGVVAPAPDKATQAAPLTTEGTEQSSPSARAGQASPGAAGGAAQDVGQAVAPVSVGQIDKEIDQPSSAKEPVSNEFLFVDIAYAKNKSPQKQAEIRDRISKLDTLTASFLMGQYEAALDGEDPAQLLQYMSPAFKEMVALVGKVGLPEQRYIYYGNSLKRGFWQAPQGEAYEIAEHAAAIGADQKRSYEGISNDQWSTAPGGSREAAWNELGKSLIGSLRYAGLALYNDTETWSRWANASIATFKGDDDWSIAKEYFGSAGEYQAHIDALPMSPEATRFQMAMTKLAEEPSLSEQGSKLWGLVKSDRAGALAYITEKGAEGVPVLLLQAIAAGVTKEPAVGVGLNIAFTAQQNHASAALNFISSKGFNVNDPKDLERLLNTPEVLREAERRGEERAFWAALTAAASGSLGSKNPLSDAALKLFGSPILAMGGETLGEIYSGEQLNAANIAMSGAVDFFNNAVSMGLDVVVGKALDRARAGGHDYIALQKMIKDSRDSVLREKDPEAYEGTIAAIVRNKKSEKIVFRVEELDFAQKSSKIDAGTFWTALKGVTKADIEAARKTGGDIKIPTEVYLTYIAHTPTGVAVTPFARFGVNGVSGAEAQATGNQLNQTLQNVGKSINDTQDKTPGPVTAAPSGAGDRAQGGDGGVEKAPDTAPSGPSTSEGSNPSAKTTGGSEPKVAPNQSGTLPVGGEKFLDSALPGASVLPDLTAITPQVVPQSQKKPPETIESKYPVKDFRSHRHVPRGQDPNIGSPPKNGPKSEKSEDDAYKETSKKFPVQEEKLKLPPVNQTPGLFLRQR